MLPTIDTQLASVRTTLRSVAERVSGDERAELVELERSVRIIERTWASRLELAWEDCRDLARLLSDLAPEEVAQVDNPEGGIPDLAEVEVAREVMRMALAHLVRSSADDQHGAAVRRRAAACLQAAARRRPW